VDIQTIRFYERQGLLPPPNREDTGYRTYKADHADKLLACWGATNLFYDFGFKSFFASPESIALDPIAAIGCSLRQSAA
jgi:hypothetical protein